MAKIQRVGDRNDGSTGIIESSLQTSVYLDGLLIAVDGSPVSDHGDNVHNAAKTDNGSSSVYIENKPVNVEGDKDTCLHKRIGGSETGNIG